MRKALGRVALLRDRSSRTRGSASLPGRRWWGELSERAACRPRFGRRTPDLSPRVNGMRKALGRVALLRDRSSRTRGSASLPGRRWWGELSERAACRHRFLNSDAGPVSPGQRDAQSAGEGRASARPLIEDAQKRVPPREALVGRALRASRLQTPLFDFGLRTCLPRPTGCAKHWGGSRFCATAHRGRAEARPSPGGGAIAGRRRGPRRPATGCTQVIPAGFRDAGRRGEGLPGRGRTCRG